MGDTIKRCPFCGTEMALRPGTRYLAIQESPFAPVEQHTELLIYTCPECRYVAMFAPPTPLEEFEARQEQERTITDPVKRFEYSFRDYPDEKLQRVVDGRDYTPEAKKAARSLLYRRKYGE